MKKKSNKADLLKRRASRKNSFGGSSYLNLPDGVERWIPEKDGTVEIDFLPYVVTDEGHPDGVEKGDTWYMRPFMIHRNVGPNNDRIICPRSMDRPCPICEAANELREGDNVDEDVLKGLWPSERALYNVVILDEKEPTVKVFDTATFLFTKKLDREIVRSQEDVNDFFELQHGHTAICDFLKEKKGQWENYPLDRVDWKLRDDYEEGVLEEVVDLDAVLIVMTYEEIDALFQGTGTEEAAPEPEAAPEVAPARKLRGAGRQRTAATPSPAAKEEEPEDDLDGAGAPSAEVEAEAEAEAEAEPESESEIPTESAARPSRRPRRRRG